MLACNRVDFKKFKAVGTTFITPGRKNQFYHGNVFNKAPVRQTSTAIDTNSAFTASYNEKNSVISESTSDKLEYFGEVNQS